MAEKETQTQTGSLQDFKFDNDNANFFGITTEENATEQVIKEVKGAAKVVTDENGGETKVTTDTTDIKEKTKEELEDEESEVTFFEDEEAKKKKTKEKTKEKVEDEDEEETTGTVDKDKKDKVKDENEDEGSEDNKFFTTLAGELKEKGIFQNVELKEGEEVTEEKFFELQDQEIEKRVEETFEAFFEEMDEDAKSFLRFKKNGGRTEEFFAAHSSTPIDLDSFDVNDAEKVDQTLRHYLTNVEKLDADELKDRLEWLKEGGKEKAYATKYNKSLADNRDKLKATVVKNQEVNAKARDEQIETFNTSLNETFDKTDTVGAFPFTKVEKKELSNYIIKPTVKIGKNKYVPAFQAEVAKIFKADTDEARQKLMLLAKLVKSDFDVTDIVKKTKTAVVKDAKSKLQDVKNGVKPSTSGGYSKKQLGDYF